MNFVLEIMKYLYWQNIYDYGNKDAFKKNDTYMYAQLKWFFFEFYKCIKRTFTKRNLGYSQ